MDQTTHGRRVFTGRLKQIGATDFSRIQRSDWERANLSQCALLSIASTPIFCTIFKVKNRGFGPLFQF